jgi:hypothetical protein
MIPGVGAATLARPFGATSPVKGEVRCEQPPLRLSPGGKGQLRQRPGAEGAPRFHNNQLSHHHPTGRTP